MARRSAIMVLAPALLIAVAVPAASGGTVLASSASAAAASPPPTPFSLSGLPAQSRGPSVATTPVTSGTHPSARLSAGSVSTGANVNVIGSNDVVQQATINGVNVFTCNPGKHTAQNETTIASSGSTLVAGANDYRLYEPSENRYDSSGGFYRSADNGLTRAGGFLPRRGGPPGRGRSGTAIWLATAPTPPTRWPSAARPTAARPGPPTTSSRLPPTRARGCSTTRSGSPPITATGPARPPTSPGPNSTVVVRPSSSPRPPTAG